jgi:DNA processing protein
VLPEPRGWPQGFGKGSPEREALLILSHLESLTPRRLRELAWREGSARRCLEAVRRGAGGERDRAFAESVDMQELRVALSACGARLVCPPDREYPARFLDLPDPPASLFVRGRSIRDSIVAVAIVGARSCSPYGRDVAESLGRGLAQNGVGVVSGAARGIDAAAHRGALSVRGDTIAVLGAGIDIAYPSVNRSLIDEIARVGTVVSEYPPGAPPLPRRFPARNRLVVALGRAVVVVEGAAGSGSLISAEFALDLDREVLAVPGPVTSPLSEVPLQLLRDGAAVVRGTGDILDTIGIAPASDAGAGNLPELSPEEHRVLDAMSGVPLTAEAVTRLAGMPIGTALSVLMSLEVRGLIQGSAGRYQRTTATMGLLARNPVGARRQ